MYRYADLRVVHLELTTRCNARCPMCARNVHGGRTRPGLPLTSLSQSDVQRILCPDLVGQLRKIDLRGNYGDPAAAPECLDVVRYLCSVNPKLRVTLATNGDPRSEAWWLELGALGVECTFGIDGLADTHELYRRGTDFERLLGHARALIRAGGRATWQFLVFRHNEHQVESARELSQRLGFHNFVPLYTGRFPKGRDEQRFDVRDRSGAFEYWLEPASLPGAAKAPRQDGHCRAVERGKIYITAEGLCFPCCWLGGLHKSADSSREHRVAEILDALPEGRSAVDAKVHPIADIVEGPFFQREIPARWGGDRPLRVCQEQCGVGGACAAASKGRNANSRS